MSSSGNLIALVLFVMAGVDLVLLGTIGLLKRKPVLLLAAVLSSAMTAFIGFLFYTGRLGAGAQ